jgi:hypothetical protein
VAEGVRGIVMGEIDDTARRLLREMGYQASERSPGDPAPEVVPREAAQNLNLDPQGPEYEAALSHLLALGDIERTPASGAQAQATEGLYRLTIQGLRRARELHWR